jgi:hypothetical protein
VAVYRALRALPRRVRRALQRKFARSLAEVALLLALGHGPAWAATINVSVAGPCTLSKAITAANTDSTAGGACTTGSGADTLVLTAGSIHTLTAVDNNTLLGATGLPLVSSTITIAGNGSTIERSSAGGTPQFRLLTVTASGNLTLQKLTLQGGHADTGGGAVYNYGICTVTNSTITGNTADSGGGGVFNAYNRTLTITNSTVSGNVAVAQPGGGVYNGGPFTLTNSTVSGNRVATNREGGGVQNYAGTATIVQSTVSGNTAFLGGGIYIFQGSVTVIQSAIANNTAAEIIATTAVPRGEGSITGLFSPSLTPRSRAIRLTSAAVYTMEALSPSPTARSRAITPAETGAG